MSRKFAVVLMPVLVFVPLASQCRLAFADDGDPVEPGPLSGRLVMFGCRFPEDAPSASRIASILPDGSDFRTEVKLNVPIVGRGFVSPDGETFAFSVQDEEPVDGVIESAAVWIKEPDVAPRSLGQSGWIQGWSSDGESLLVYRLVNDVYENLLIHIATGGVETLELGDESVAQTFTIDGAEVIAIAMNSGRSYVDPVRGNYPQRQLFLWDRKSGLRSVFTDPEHDCIWPVISPDGESIAFYLRRHEDRPHEHQAVADADGANVREVFRLDDVTDKIVIRPVGAPQWSSDGTEIAWLRSIKEVESNETRFEILFVSADGSTSRRLPLESPWGHMEWVP